nr:glycerate kinase [Actinomycetales bacterium]
MTPGILVASDKWKGSLTSAEVGALVAAGLHRTIPGVPVTVIPVADGGDGSVAAALAAGFEPRTIRVEVPYSRAFDHVTAWRGAEVVVEVA